MWRCTVAACLLLCATRLASGLGEYSRVVSYRDQIVVRCADKRKGTVQLLQQNTDKWHVGEQSIDLRMPRETFAAIQKFVPECYVLIEDVEAHVQTAETQMFPARVQEEEAWAKTVLEDLLKTKPSLEECEAAIQNWENSRFQEADAWFEEYHNYDAIVMWYRHQAQEHPTLVHYMESIGKSYQGLDMPAVHITASNNPQRLKIYFQCQIHAREWISGAVCMYIVNYLLTNYGQTSDKAKEVTYLLDNLEFIIVPFVNPDGYVYTWSNDRLWRKNRHVVASQLELTDPKCVGVDINRNFPEGWKKGGKSHPPQCSEDYGGPNPGSEPETQNIMKYWKSNGPIIGAIDWHSYGKLVLHPWAWTKKDTHHDDTLITLGQEMVDIIKTVHGKIYKSEKSIDLYQCFGIATDWFYSDDASSNNGGYRSAAFVIELRGGNAGFLLPAEQIVPTAEEVVPAVIHFAKYLLSKPIPFRPKDAAIQDMFQYYRYTGSPEYSS